MTQSPADASEEADFLVTMLSDTDAIEGAVGGDTLTALAERAVWVQTSTVGPEANERLQKITDEHGVAYVDAPSSGPSNPPSRRL